MLYSRLFDFIHEYHAEDDITFLATPLINCRFVNSNIFEHFWLEKYEVDDGKSKMKSS